MLCRAKASKVSHVGLDAATDSVFFSQAVSPSVRALIAPEVLDANRRLHRPHSFTHLLTLPLEWLCLFKLQAVPSAPQTQPA